MNNMNLAQLLLRAYYWVDEGLQNQLKARGWPQITRAQSMVFTNINEGRTRPSEIAHSMGISRQAVHQTINELIKMRLVELIPDPHDRRAKVVVPTEEGKRIADDAKAGLEMVESTLEGRIGPERMEALRMALQSEWGKEIS